MDLRRLADLAWSILDDPGAGPLARHRADLILDLAIAEALARGEILARQPLGELLPAG